MGPKPRSIDRRAMDVENSCLLQRRNAAKKYLLTHIRQAGAPVTAREMRWLRRSWDDDPTEGTYDMNLTASDCDLVAVGTS